MNTLARIHASRGTFSVHLESGAEMKTQTRFVGPAVLGSILWLLTPATLSAVPAFARQTGASCSSCHFQHFPGLTAYGRFFKSFGFTLSGPQQIVEGKRLSLPNLLNAALITKFRYVKTNGSSGIGTDVGEFQFPNEAQVWVTGRIGSTVGLILETQLTDPDSPILASFKLPIGFSTRIGRIAAIPFSTDGLGAPFAFELLNTGAVRDTRMLEEPSAFSAAQYVVGDVNERGAEGIAFTWSGRLAFLSVTPWTPNSGTVGLDRPAWYFRAGITPHLGEFDIGLGVQRWTGTVPTANKGADAWGVDLQLQSRPGSPPIGLYAGYARAAASRPMRSVFFSPEGRAPDMGIEGATLTPERWLAPPANFFNLEPYAQEAISVLLEVGIIPRRVTGAAGYRLGDNGKTARNQDIATAFGATYLLAHNIQLQVNHVIYTGDAWTDLTGHQKTIVMMFAAF
jgi:hypothetical protein